MNCTHVRLCCTDGEALRGTKVPLQEGCVMYVGGAGEEHCLRLYRCVMDTLGGWLSEIRFFYMRQVSVPLSPHGQALWHWLMWRANTVFWQFPLRLSLREIAGGTKMSEPMVKRARAELVKGGFLLHEDFGGKVFEMGR